MENFSELSDDEKEFYYGRASEFLHGRELLYCTRVWSAWSVGTMTENDFYSADDDESLIVELAEHIFNIVRGKLRKDKIKKILEC